MAFGNPVSLHVWDGSIPLSTCHLLQILPNDGQPNPTFFYMKKTKVTFCICFKHLLWNAGIVTPKSWRFLWFSSFFWLLTGTPSAPSTSTHTGSHDAPKMSRLNVSILLINASGLGQRALIILIHLVLVTTGFLVCFASLPNPPYMANTTTYMLLPLYLLIFLSFFSFLSPSPFN